MLHDVARNFLLVFFFYWFFLFFFPALIFQKVNRIRVYMSLQIDNKSEVLRLSEKKRKS